MSEWREYGKGLPHVPVIDSCSSRPGAVATWLLKTQREVEGVAKADSPSEHDRLRGDVQASQDVVGG